MCDHTYIDLIQGAELDIVKEHFITVVNKFWSRSTGHYFQHAHSIPIVGVGKRGAYYLVHGDLPRQHSFGTSLRFTGLVPADSRQ